MSKVLTKGEMKSNIDPKERKQRIKYLSNLSESCLCSKLFRQYFTVTVVFNKITCQIYFDNTNRLILPLLMNSSLTLQI